MTDLFERYELGRPLAVGGQGLLRVARRKSDGLEVVIKKYSQMEDATNWTSLDEGEVGAAREISFLERANRDGVAGVPCLLEYGIAGAWGEPVAVFKKIPGSPLREKVSESGYNPSLSYVDWIAKSVRDILQYAHHSNGAKPVVHRDISPENIMVNGDSVVLMDWATATPTSGKTYHGKTHIAKWYYTAPEVQSGRPFDGRADIYSLGRVLQLMLLGNRFEEDLDGKVSEKDFDNLNIPKGVVKVLQKATRENQEQRYRTVSEFYDAFESALGRSLQVHGQSSKPQPQISYTPKRTGNLLHDSATGALGEILPYDFSKKAIFGYGGAQLDLIESRNIHSVLEKLWKGKGTDEEKGKLAFAYLLHEAREHPILQDALLDGKTLEGRVLDIRKIENWDERHEKLEELKYASGIPTNNLDTFFGSTMYATRDWPFVAKTIIRGLLAVVPISYSLKKACEYLDKKQLRQLDTRIYQARVAQGLETRVEDVELGGEEEKRIDRFIGEYRGLEAAAGTFSTISGALGLFGVGSFDNPYALAGSATVLLASLASSSLRTNGQLKKYLTNRALRRKRLEAGLPSVMPKQEMREYGIVILNYETGGSLKESLKQAGLKKKLWQKRFIGNGVKLEYYSTHRHEPQAGWETIITVNATSEEKASDVIETIREKFPQAEVRYPISRRSTPIPEPETSGIDTSRRVGGGANK